MRENVKSIIPNLNYKSYTSQIIGNINPENSPLSFIFAALSENGEVSKEPVNLLLYILYKKIQQQASNW